LELHANYGGVPGGRPCTPARAVHASPARFKIIVTGRRASKTTTAAEQFLHQIYCWDLPRRLSWYSPGAAPYGTAEWWKRRPRLHYWIVGPTFKLLEETQRALLAAMPPEALEHANTGSRTWWLRPDIYVQFISAKDHQKLVSVGLDGIWLEEAALIHPQAWQGRLRQTLANKAGWAIVTSTPMGRNWLYTDLVEPALRGEEGYQFFTWRTVDNDQVPALRAEVERDRRIMPAAYFKREYEASFEAFMGQVFAEWGAAHELPELPEGLVFHRRTGGQDWGTSKPGAQEVIGTSALGAAYVVDEEYAAGKLVENFWAPSAVRLTKKWGIGEWICDPAEPDNIIRLRRAGLRCRKHTNLDWTGKFEEHDRSVMAGVRQLALMAQAGRLFALKKNAPHFCEEMRNLVWDESNSLVKGEEWEESLAPNQKDHGFDAARYAITATMRPPTLRALGTGRPTSSGFA
jgi:hypothetical protein